LNDIKNHKESQFWYNYVMDSKLYLISTPIGNLKDTTLRAIDILSSIDVLACEDTRKAGLLLKKLEIKSKPQLLSYYEENEVERIPQIVSLIKSGKNIALISNAGTPAISDPGFKLVRECIKKGIKVEVIPGASAVLSSLVLSGLPTDKFMFLGFLPRKESKRKKLLTSLPKKTTIVLFVSPHRLVKRLKELKSLFGDINIVVCRELTKIHEEVRREKINQLIKHFKQTKPKGELTILFYLP